ISAVTARRPAGGYRPGGTVRHAPVTAPKGRTPYSAAEYGEPAGVTRRSRSRIRLGRRVRGRCRVGGGERGVGEGPRSADPKARTTFRPPRILLQRRFPCQWEPRSCFVTFP